jgi:serine/threonine protein kinase
MSPECQHIIEGMLMRDPSQRLGGKSQSDAVLQHPFFRGQSWDDLLAKAIKPPFKSKTASLEDTNNFHKAFTTQRATDSGNHVAILNEAQQANFEGFT